VHDLGRRLQPPHLEEAPVLLTVRGPRVIWTPSRSQRIEYSFTPSHASSRSQWVWTQVVFTNITRWPIDESRFGLATSTSN